MQQMRIGAGQTPPGKTQWVQYGNTGLYVDIDTSAAEFSAVPMYFTSIGGDSQHWDVVGCTAVYNATAKSLRIFIRIFDNRAITPALAQANRWHINWVGVQLFPG